jgi:fumarylacetoacetase
VAPERGSWVPGADGSGFGIEHLPYGVIRPAGESPRVAVRIGGWALDVAEVVAAGLLVVPGLTVEVLRSPALNGFLELGPSVWSATRASVIALLDAAGGGERGVGALGSRALLDLSAVEVMIPVAVGDYVDFYSSLAHASNLGRIMRPGSEGLLPNWRHLPVGYHGRAGSIVVSGTPIRRPWGQRGPGGGGAGPSPAGAAPSPVGASERPSFGPERQLDFELELGFVTGARPRAAPIAVSDASEHIFGVVLVNDWSAREIQRWEAQPLGPFLGKSFATSIAGWVTPLEALAAHRVPGAVQDPPVLPYLHTDEPWTFDIDLEVAIVPGGSGSETTVTRTSARELYWNAAQQLAHASSGGAAVRAGDLFASGTISGAEPGSYGSLIELSWGGTRALALDGATRTFLEDGDTVIMRGLAAGGGGRSRLELGEVRGTVLGAGA